MARSSAINTYDTLIVRVSFSQRGDIEIGEDQKRCVVSLSPKGAERFQQGIGDLREGGGDWAIVGEGKNDALWFWPL